MSDGLGVSLRRVRRVLWSCALTGALMAACQPLLVAQDAAPKRLLGQDLPVYVPAAGDSARPAGALQNPAGVLTLRDALTLGLLQNPALAAYAWEVRAREARALQAGRAHNPSAAVTFEDYGARQLAGGGINEPVQPQTTIQLSQLIELGGKRAARERLAGLNRDLASWDYEAARIDALAEVTRVFLDVLGAQAMVGQIDETTRLVDAVRQSVSQRVQAGDVSPIEETRADVALAAVRIEASKAQRHLVSQRTRLSVLWGSNTPVFTSVAGDLNQAPMSLPAFDRLLAQVQQNPDLARWATEFAQREAALAVERAKAVPDVSVNAGYRRYTGVDTGAFVVGATVTLPIFDKNRGGIAEAESRAVKAREEQRASEGRVIAVLADAYAVLASAFDEVTALKNTVIPGSQQAFDAVSEGYRLGRFRLADVLDAQRTLVTANSQYVSALSGYHKAVAHIERLIGAPLIDRAAQDR